MRFWEKLFSKGKDTGSTAAVQQRTSQKEPAGAVEEISEDDYSAAGLTFPVSAEESERVSVIASAILAGDRMDAKIRVKRVLGIDAQRVDAGIIAAAIAADDCPNTAFRLKRVSEYHEPPMKGSVDISEKDKEEMKAC